MTTSPPSVLASPGGEGDISRLLIPVAPIGPGTSVEAAADLLLHPAFEGLLCLPVVVAGEPVGTLSRPVEVLVGAYSSTGA